MATQNDRPTADEGPRSIQALAEQFADCLRQAEDRHDPEPLVALFTEEAELRSFVHEEPVHGRDGARTFWREYLGSFRELRSRFEAVNAAGRIAVLEWITEGTLTSGTPITYRGVSVLEFEGDRVRSFRTYYDSARLGGRHREARPTDASVAQRIVP